MDYSDLTSLEKDLVRSVATGQDADCRSFAASGQTGASTEQGRGMIRSVVLHGLLTNSLNGMAGTCPGRVKIRGAAFSGDLDLSYVEPTLAWLKLSDCTFDGSIELDASTIRGLSLIDTTVVTLSMDESTVSGSLELIDCKLETMSMTASTINGTSVIERCGIGNGGTEALIADRVTTSGLFVDGCTFEGSIRLVGSRIDGALAIRGCSLPASVPASASIVAEDIRVNGAMFFSLSAPPAGVIDFAFSRIAGPLIDTLSSWPAQIRLNGFTYRSLEGDERRVNDRLSWLEKSSPFVPETYTQLSSAYRTVGLDESARQVVIARERAKRKRGRLPWPQRFLNLILDVTVSHGYRPWRALLPFGILAVVFGILFSLPVAKTAMTSTNPTGPISARATCRQYVCYSGPVYVLDVMLPVIDFHQESKWEPNPHAPWGWAFRLAQWSLIGVGWLLTTSVVAGISLVWRRE